jgi:hypothetical protein
MYAQELALHYSEVRRRLRAQPVARPVLVVVPVAEPEPEPDRSQIGAAPEPAPAPPVITVTMPVPTYPSIRSIVAATAAHYGVPVIDLMSQRRQKSIILPRQIAMYLARVITPRSLPDIGRNMGGRDHTTIHHAYHKIARLAETDPEVAASIDCLRSRLEVAQ